jgi:hypothetical protein
MQITPALTAGSNSLQLDRRSSIGTNSSSCTVLAARTLKLIVCGNAGECMSQADLCCMVLDVDLHEQCVHVLCC